MGNNFMISKKTRNSGIISQIRSRLLLSDLLTQAGFSLQEAENGAEAVAKFQEWQPHVIWMDVRMPGMDGYEVTEKIRALPGGDQVNIVAVTASVIDDPQRVIQDTGVDGVQEDR